MKIEHIAMYVKDLEKTKTFFEIYLNARANAGYYNPKTDFRSYFLSFDDGARLEIMNKPQMQDSPKAPTQTGYIHIAFSVGSKEKVDELTAKLKEDGRLSDIAPTILDMMNLEKPEQMTGHSLIK